MTSVVHDNKARVLYREDMSRDGSALSYASSDHLSEPIPRIIEGKTLGNLLGVKGTPTVVINGWKLERPPTLDRMDHMAKSILAGKRPVGSR
jgi:hypothetical protein